MLQYLQDGCNSGRLRFTITGLHVSEFGGTPAWPDFYTRDNVLGTPPTLEIEGVAIRLLDTDEDGLPDDWENVHFSSLSPTAQEDADSDGLSNRAEFITGTDSLNPESMLTNAHHRESISGAHLDRAYEQTSHNTALSWVQP